MAESVLKGSREQRVRIAKAGVNLTANSVTSIDLSQQVNSVKPAGTTFDRLEFLGAWPEQTWNNAMVVRCFRGDVPATTLDLIAAGAQRYTVQVLAVYKLGGG